MVRRDLLKFRWSLECPGCGFKVNGDGQPEPGAASGEVRPLHGGPGPGGRVMVRTTVFRQPGEGMSEMEMLRELRRIIAIVAGQDLAAGRVTGTIAQAKDQVREELVAMVQEKFAANLASAKNGLG